MPKSFTFRRPWKTWYGGGRRDVLVPLGPAKLTRIEVPLATATYTGLEPTVNIKPVIQGFPLKIDRAYYADPKKGVFRNKGSKHLRRTVIPLLARPLDVAVIVDLGVATYTGRDPIVRIEDFASIDVPLGQATYTGFAPTIVADEKPPPPEPKPGGRPYLMRPRRRRYHMPDGRFFETDNESEVLLRLQWYLNQQAKEDQLTRPKDERPRLPFVSQPEDIEDLETYVGGPSLMDLPALRAMEAQIQGQQVQSIDPQLLSVLLQRIDDEEAAMLLL